MQEQFTRLERIERSHGMKIHHGVFVHSFAQKTGYKNSSKMCFQLYRRYNHEIIIFYKRSLDPSWIYYKIYLLLLIITIFIQIIYFSPDMNITQPNEQFSTNSKNKIFPVPIFPLQKVVFPAGVGFRGKGRRVWNRSFYHRRGWYCCCIKLHRSVFSPPRYHHHHAPHSPWETRVPFSPSSNGGVDVAQFTLHATYDDWPF